MLEIKGDSFSKELYHPKIEIFMPLSVIPSIIAKNLQPKLKMKLQKSVGLSHWWKVETHRFY